MILTFFYYLCIVKMSIKYNPSEKQCVDDERHA